MEDCKEIPKIPTIETPGPVAYTGFGVAIIVRVSRIASDKRRNAV